MISTGLKLSQEGKTAFQALKDGEHRYVAYKISGMEVALDSTGPKEDDFKKAYEAFLDTLPKDKCRFIVYNFPHTNLDGKNLENIVLIYWCPPDCTTKEKMMASASLQGVKGELSLKIGEFQGQERDDIVYDVIRQRVI